MLTLLDSFKLKWDYNMFQYNKSYVYKKDGLNFKKV